MSRRAIRMATALALVAVVGAVAAALLMAGADGARAFNAGGVEGTARLMPIPAQYTEQCSNGTVVANPEDNAGLVADCAALLASKSTLEGTGARALSLNWSADRAIGNWRGVRVSDGRVARLGLSNGAGHTGDWLTGEIPAQLGNLSNLTYLSFSNNSLTGEIPAQLGGLSNLRELWISSNRLTGAIPSELGNLSELRLLSISNNSLTGDIPAQLGNLSNLGQLYLHGNRLTGDIPAELGDTNLGLLYLYANQLTGEIPAELGDLSNLGRLYLSANQLTGEIPSELGKLSNLDHLYLNHNQLTGRIPAELGDLSDLGRLYLHNNQLTGQIPSELSNLSNLGDWWLRHNQLTGEIPPELGRLPKLWRLLLNDNELSGQIPAELGNISTLTILDLRNNRFTGCIPESLREPLASQARGIEDLGLPICDATTATATPTATSVSGATPTPTATSVPGARETPVATLTPTATSVASGDVMGRLAALERQVAEIPALRTQVAEIPALKEQVVVLATRVARFEGGGAATATPTPSATPVRVIEATGVAGVERTPAACVESLAGSGSVRGNWSSGCLSANPPSSADYYARFYTFTLDAAAQVTVTLSSDSLRPPYLYLLDGAGRDGAVRLSKGSATASSVAISASLGAGAYTIEASTWYSETVGDFTLELEIAR